MLPRVPWPTTKSTTAVGLPVVCCGLPPLVVIAGVSVSALASAGAAVAALSAGIAVAVFACCDGA